MVIYLGFKLVCAHCGKVHPGLRNSNTNDKLKLSSSLPPQHQPQPQQQRLNDSDSFHRCSNKKRKKPEGNMHFLEGWNAADSAENAVEVEHEDEEEAEKEVEKVLSGWSQDVSDPFVEEDSLYPDEDDDNHNNSNTRSSFSSDSGFICCWCGFSSSSSPSSSSSSSNSILRLFAEGSCIIDDSTAQAQLCFDGPRLFALLRLNSSDLHNLRSLCYQCGSMEYNRQSGFTETDQRVLPFISSSSSSAYSAVSASFALPSLSHPTTSPCPFVSATSLLRSTNSSPNVISLKSILQPRLQQVEYRGHWSIVLQQFLVLDVLHRMNFPFNQAFRLPLNAEQLGFAVASSASATNDAFFDSTTGCKRRRIESSRGFPVSMDSLSHFPLPSLVQRSTCTGSHAIPSTFTAPKLTLRALWIRPFASDLHAARALMQA